MKRSGFVFLLIGMLLLAACVPSTTVPPTDTSAPPSATPVAVTNTPAPADTTGAPATDTSAPTDTTAPTDTSAPTDTTAPTDTAMPSDTTMPTGTPAATSGPASTAGAPTYLDDRSDPAALMNSFANAINTHQYLRAYSYWRPGAAGLPTFDIYEAGYSTTQSIQITLGTITGDAGAGQLYYSVPATLVSQSTNNTTQTYVGCYILHLSQPGIQGTPPFQGLSIDSATVNAVASNADTNALMAAACQIQGGPIQVTPVPAPDDISAARYLDDRSDAVQVLRSLYNAVNRQETLRAYSYWEPTASGLPTYTVFAQGYANTQVVTLTVGTVNEDAGAGQRYWTVPVTLVSTSTSNVVTTFVACYTLHLGLPDAQGVPPYQPIGIRSAKVNMVANNADTGAMMASICQQG
jgi:hypothetical protein